VFNTGACLSAVGQLFESGTPLKTGTSRGGIHKKNCRLKKSKESSTRFFPKTYVPNTGRSFYLPGASPPLPILPILSIPFSSEIDPIGIMQAILAS